MYSIKQAQLLMGALPLADVTIYYIDIRAFGKGYEEFFEQAKGMGVRFVKGKVAKPEFRELIAGANGKLRYADREVRNIVYVYCVGSRQAATEENPHPNLYCSRFCCTAAVHTALLANGIDGGVNQYHLYRDMRTYGKSEILFEEAGRKGSVFVRYADDAPPVVERPDGDLLVRVRDGLLGGEEIGIPAAPGLGAPVHKYGSTRAP